MSPAHCTRWPDRPDIVYGTRMGKLRSCVSERTNNIVERLFRIDKCGPEGKYFEPHASRARIRRTPPAASDE